MKTIDMITSKKEFLDFLYKGYKIKSGSWGDDAYVRLYSKEAQTVIDEEGAIYPIDTIWDDELFYIDSTSKPKRKSEIEENITFSNEELDYDPDWIRRVNILFNADGAVYRIINSDSILIIDRRSGKVGKSRCHPDDEFDTLKGTAISYARLRGMTPKYITIKTTKVSNLIGGIIKYDKISWVVIPDIKNSKNCTLVFNGVQGDYRLTRTIPSNTLIPQCDIIVTVDDLLKTYYAN